MQAAIVLLHVGFITGLGLGLAVYLVV